MVLDPELCPDCGSLLTETTWAEPALFFFGGYGGTRETVSAICSQCRWHHIRAINTTRPTP